MGRTILLDSNLAVLLCVGATGEENIARHKRLNSFDAVDYRLLVGELRNAEGVAICPNIATEVSNLVAQSHDKLREAAMDMLCRFFASSEERVVASLDASSDVAFERFGLTDAVILHILAASPDTQLLTADFPLYQVAHWRGLNAVSFNHLREQRPDFH